MATRLAVLALSIVTLSVTLGACGKQIGDSCLLSSDCSPNGDRVCLCSFCSGTTLTQTPDQGYCTVQGCDYSTCPDEAVCIRFFTGDFDNRVCDPDTQAGCSLDEMCAINGHCAPRSSEIRYCMSTCDGSGDCRDGYECRDFALAKQHGGEQVFAPPKPGDKPTPPESQSKFCAAKPPT
ncbi:MAG TPA: hypothetical protein VF469_11910 [Kofleriaceae bacterium]